MAYSDYGGYAYRNGELTRERSDCSLTKNGETYHALLGDGKIRLGLYKQTCVDIYLDVAKIGEIFPNYNYGDNKDSHMVIFDHRIDIYWKSEDNLYQYVKLEQPDKVIWTGFSGYGVGAGFEFDEYGYSSQNVEEQLKEIFNMVAK